MVMVLVMDCEQMQISVGKLPAAPGAYPGMDTQGSFTISFHTLILSLAGLFNDPIHLLSGQFTFF